MNSKFILQTIIGLWVVSVVVAQQKLNIAINFDNVVSIQVDSTIHQDYGLSYPLTYEFLLPITHELAAQRRYSSNDPWTTIEEKQAGDFFNGIEAVRYDSLSQTAYLSATFSYNSDSLFLRITDDSGANQPITFQGISEYYDNRVATVTCSADDWADWFDEYFPYAVSVFRDHNLWLSVGIISEGCNPTTWQHIQEQLDLGMVEAASHSRNHPHTPYSDADYEVSGSKSDIIENLDLPSTFRKGDQEYVYLWIAPYGEYDDQIDALVASNQYLVSRMYTSGDYSFPEWVDEQSFYGSVGMSSEVGPFWEGTTDLAELNGSFDTAYELNGIYHFMCHPHVLSQENIWNEDYIWTHMDYISNRDDIWYASVGQVFLYHLMQDQESFNTLEISENNDLNIPEFTLHQNFPNPFNPSTTIQYFIPVASSVKISIYDVLGHAVRNLVDKQQNAGSYKISWNGLDDEGHTVNSGMYFYKLSVDNFSQTRKMLFLK
ncbi:MAG: T9SS type A sorting domain-containing protein [Candidatus Marinimicrobia bacterium]|jgi:hypothetical protein|nr:T9SS type A sorting domain-containing protein [Candidatus Neomarinimicrobiota bacterium]MBT3574611.1 T9SS type A sorting domain-containing protein [Candidatus Neomarinimicrobiota bacterium]MBT3680325.1 T9SS type A sorting domain-containing protein [Candidatus Neomarinimicrobiota bacterium]MBT3950933.1 T9SS type A sorting domain-containing protein [Candidatus Neomarinimicrobiota bacterium]MBT4252219.1 T9SS type A sorting domain-containing protein [Candidatus Neomarinimicrobiota bacterium]